MQYLSARAKTMLRSAITSTVSLLAIALAIPQMARAEFFWCAAKGFTWTADAAGNDLREEKAEIRLMVQVDGPNGNVKYREPIEGDDWAPWGPWRTAISDRYADGGWKEVELIEQISIPGLSMNTKTEFTISRDKEFDFTRTQDTVFPKFVTKAVGNCSPY